VSASLAPGLYGKLPAHGDFVARGWPAGITEALDAWLAAGIAATRDRSDDFAAAMTAGPLWACFLPAEGARPALHGVLTPTVDSVGRFFMLVAGIAGDAAGVWAAASQHPAFVRSTEAAVYEGLSGTLDADGLHARVADAVPALDAPARFLGGLSTPDEAVFWVAEPAQGAPLGIRSAMLDAQLLARLILGEEIACA
jgi:type VI secretion system protein ImpM